MGDMNFPDNPALEEGYLDWSWDGEKWVHNGLTGLESMPANITTADVKLTNPQLSDFETQEDANNYFYESIQNGGGGGDPFPEAPVDGKQYGRQDAGWTEIVHTGGGDGNADLTNYYTKPETDDKFQVKGDYLTEFTEEDPTVPSHVKAITTSDINKWNNPPTGGGGGGAVNSVNGKTGDVNLTYSDVGAQVAGSYAASNHNHSGVYQPVGNYAASNHNHSGVYQPVGNYALVGASYTKAESDAKYELKGQGGGDPFPWTGATATFNGTSSGSTIQVKNSGSRGPEIALVNGASATSTKYIRAYGNELQVVKSNYGGVIFRITEGGEAGAKDFLASSDERLKKDIAKAPLGVIDQIEGSVWTWKDGGEKGSGVIAQQIESVLPHLVTDDDEGMKSVSYSGLFGYMIEEIKDLKLRLAELEGRGR